PVAVDERPREAIAVARDVAVLRQVVQRLLELGRERLGGIAVVMEMDLDLAEAAARELGEWLDEVRPILLAGKEPTVTRWPAVVVTKFVEPRVAFRPRCDARAPDVVGSVPPQRLVVIAQREQQVTRAARVWRARTTHEVTCVIGQPLVEVL